MSTRRHAALPVLARYKRHLAHDRSARFPADYDAQFGPNLVQSMLDVRHGDVSLQRRAWAPRCDATYLCAPRIDYLDALPSRCTLNNQPDPAAADISSRLQLLQNAFRAVESAFLPPRLCDYP